VLAGEAGVFDGHHGGVDFAELLVVGVGGRDDAGDGLADGVVGIGEAVDVFGPFLAGGFPVVGAGGAGGVVEDEAIGEAAEGW
jgi:hypothetical protein